jgi:hypothetical protein
VPPQTNDRYEPLPGFFELPGFLWRRTPRAGKIALVALGVGLVVLAIVLSPVIQHSKEQQASEEARLRALHQKQEIAQIRREQTPRLRRGTPGGTNVAARGRLLDSAEASIMADANKRAAAGEFNGPIKRVRCDSFPRNASGVTADQIPSKRTGRYGCLAITSDIPATAGNRAGVVGHPYRMKIDFTNGRYAFCKIRGRPGELAVRANALVPVPPVCGG